MDLNERGKAMTSANTPTGSSTCAFPGCERPPRARAGEGGGKPPSYCDLVNPATGKLAHTPLTAARERDRLQRQSVTGQPAGLAGETPASAARDRAATLLDQFRTTAEQMAGTLAAAVEAMTSAGDPESVSAELTAARRTVDRIRLESDERIQAADQARDDARADAETARRAAAEATAARDEAMGELDTVEVALTAARAELEQARADHREELGRVRSEAEQQLTAAEQRAAEQIRTTKTDAVQRVQAAETARDQALAEASAARQAASDATGRADEARAELRQARTDHREELATLRRERREELGAERQRSDAALDTLRGEHRREVEALQEALTTLRAVAQQDTAQPQEAQPERKRR